MIMRGSFTLRCLSTNEGTMDPENTHFGAGETALHALLTASGRKDVAQRAGMPQQPRHPKYIKDGGRQEHQQQMKGKSSERKVSWWYDKELKEKTTLPMLSQELYHSKKSTRTFPDPFLSSSL